MPDRDIRSDITRLREEMEHAGSAEERVMLDLILRDRQADLESCRLRLTGRDLTFARRSH